MNHKSYPIKLPHTSVYIDVNNIKRVSMEVTSDLDAGDFDHFIFIKTHSDEIYHCSRGTRDQVYADLLHFIREWKIIND